MDDIFLPNEFDTVEYESVGFEDTTTQSKNTILYDELHTLLDPIAFTNVKPFLAHIGKYIDKHMDALLISAPYESLFFNEKIDGDPLYEIFGFSKRDITSIIKKSSVISETFITLNNPLFFLLTGLNMIYRDKGEVELYREGVKYASLFMAMRFYSSRQLHLWKYGANKDIMEYTINHITDKFLLRKEKTVFGVLKYIANDNDLNLGARLYNTHTDTNFKSYITNLSTRINNFLRNIYNEYLKNHDKQNYLGESKDRYDDENKTVKELDNVSSAISSMAQKVYDRIKTGSLDQAILKDATAASQISANTIRNTLELIFKNETDSLRLAITAIIQLFLQNPKNKIEYIKSKYFMIYCLNIYRISNTVDPVLEKLKATLDIWIQTYGAQFLRLNRAATKSNFRKSVYIYICASITKYA